MKVFDLDVSRCLDWDFSSMEELLRRVRYSKHLRRIQQYLLSRLTPWLDDPQEPTLYAPLYSVNIAAKLDVTGKILIELLSPTRDDLRSRIRAVLHQLSTLFLKEKYLRERWRAACARRRVVA